MLNMHYAIYILRSHARARNQMRNCATWPRGYKTFSMLSSVKHEVLNAHKYKKYQEIRRLLGSDKLRMLSSPLINVKMPTIVGILTFMSRKNFMLSWVEHEKCFITSGPGHCSKFKIAKLYCNQVHVVPCKINNKVHVHVHISKLV